MIFGEKLPIEPATSFAVSAKLGLMRRRAKPRSQKIYPNRLREVRVALGLSLHEAADVTGISYDRFGRYERLERQLCITHIELIAARLKVRPQRLFVSVDPIADAQAEAMLSYFTRFSPKQREWAVAMFGAVPPEEETKPS